MNAEAERRLEQMAREEMNTKFNAEDEVERLRHKFEMQSTDTVDEPRTPTKQSSAPYATNESSYSEQQQSRIDFVGHASSQRDALTAARNNRQKQYGESPIAHKYYSSDTKSPLRAVGSPSSSAPFATDDANNVPYKREAKAPPPAQDLSRPPTTRRPPGGYSSFTLG